MLQLLRDVEPDLAHPLAPQMFRNVEKVKGDWVAATSDASRKGVIAQLLVDFPLRGALRSHFAAPQTYSKALKAILEGFDDSGIECPLEKNAFQEKAQVRCRLSRCASLTALLEGNPATVARHLRDDQRVSDPPSAETG